MLMEDLENECNDAVYLIEALPRNESIINTMLQMRLVDEIVICTVPVMQGNGTRLFRTCIPPATCWESESTSISKNGTVRTVFRKIGPFDKKPGVNRIYTPSIYFTLLRVSSGSRGFF